MQYTCNLLASHFFNLMDFSTYSNSIHKIWLWALNEWKIEKFSCIKSDLNELHFLFKLFFCLEHGKCFFGSSYLKIDGERKKFPFILYSFIFSIESNPKDKHNIFFIIFNSRICWLLVTDTIINEILHEGWSDE